VAVALDFVHGPPFPVTQRRATWLPVPGFIGLMAKLVRRTTGAILDVVVNLRVGSPSFGRAYRAELTDENHHQLLVPVGCGHAFLTLLEVADVEHKCSGYYDPTAEATVAWNDREIGVRWPIRTSILSQRTSGG
jgi:dTDP-4-dehydrorhamnose 3,5-epimerase